ncbi:TPA: hypothetical protein PXR57_003947, partial [Yersinia enterocolitica]|nr:hypothetical protein [Yersinia enterocolitica]
MQVPRHIIVAASAWGSRLVSIFVQFYSIRILLDLLGTDRYAVFTVTGSLVGWFLLADFGLGNSLQNQISHRRVNNQEYQDIILCAGIAIIPIFILLTLVVIVSSSFLSEFLFGNFYFLDNSQKKEIFRVASLIFLATAIGNISFKIWFSEHKGWISNIIPAVSSIFGLVLIANLTAKNLEV